MSLPVPASKQRGAARGSDGLDRLLVYLRYIMLRCSPFGAVIEYIHGLIRFLLWLQDPRTDSTRRHVDKIRHTAGLVGV